MAAMTPPPRLALLVCALALLATVGAAALSCTKGASEGVSAPSVLLPAPPSPSPVALLDGVVLPAETVAEVNGRLPVAVMVDNFPWGARPQIGLDRADLVYELLVEGGVTRFMAVYLRQEAERIEPVRSARTPTALLAKELDALLAHVGAAHKAGEADARHWLAAWSVRALDGDEDMQPFWRDGARQAPYNMATSTEALRARAAELGWSGPGRTASWLFRDDGGDEAVHGASARQIEYNFALQFPAHPAFAVAWTYDEESGGYLRAMAGQPHVDGLSGVRLSARNVVVQFAKAATVSREGHVVYEQIGEGQAWIFRDGHAIEATWSKRSHEERTRYRDANGEEIRLSRGATWVALLPTGSPFRWE